MKKICKMQKKQQKVTMHLNAHIQLAILKLLNPKADIHFIVQQRVEG